MGMMHLHINQKPTDYDNDHLKSQSLLFPKMKTGVKIVCLLQPWHFKFIKLSLLYPAIPSKIESRILR